MRARRRFAAQASLEEHLSQARELVQTLKTQAEADPGKAKRQAQAAKLRAAQERESASGRRWSNCPKWPRPRSATAPRPKTRGPAPPMPTRGS
jgi:hypothetical protein